jgi:hypothetical protein
MNIPINIVTQWYREELNDESRRFYALWRQALRRFAPDVPILLIDNGGPTRPPYADVEVVPAVDMLPHERGRFSHYYNCWRSMSYAWELSRLRGIRCSIFISQNLIPGIPFTKECAEALSSADILFNTGCLGPGLAYTEYVAVNPQTTEALTRIRYAEGMALLEGMLPIWSFQLKLREAPFPGFHRLRDAPFDPQDTFAHHLPFADVLTFAHLRGIRVP